MSFLRTTVRQGSIRAFSSTRPHGKGLAESVKNAARAVDHSAASAALKGLEAAEHVRDKVVGAHDAVSEHAGKAKGKAEEAAGTAAGRKEQAVGAVKGKASEYVRQFEDERDL